jgi:hypothetical protein
MEPLTSESALPAAAERIQDQVSDRWRLARIEGGSGQFGPTEEELPANRRVDDGGDSALTFGYWFILVRMGALGEKTRRWRIFKTHSLRVRVGSRVL